MIKVQVIFDMDMLMDVIGQSTTKEYSTSEYLTLLKHLWLGDDIYTFCLIKKGSRGSENHRKRMLIFKLTKVSLQTIQSRSMDFVPLIPFCIKASFLNKKGF